MNILICDLTSYVHISIHCESLLCSLLSTVADSGSDHDEEYTNIQHFYGNKITDETDEGVFQVRKCQEQSDPLSHLYVNLSLLLTCYWHVSVAITCFPVVFI